MTLSTQVNSMFIIFISVFEDCQIFGFSPLYLSLIFFIIIIQLLFSYSISHYIHSVCDHHYFIIILYHHIFVTFVVLQSMKAKEREALTPIALRKRAAEYAGEAINSQREVRTFIHMYWSAYTHTHIDAWRVVFFNLIFFFVLYYLLQIVSWFIYLFTLLLL